MVKKLVMVFLVIFFTFHEIHAYGAVVELWNGGIRRLTSRVIIPGVRSFASKAEELKREQDIADGLTIPGYTPPGSVKLPQVIIDTRQRGELKFDPYSSRLYYEDPHALDGVDNVISPTPYRVDDDVVAFKPVPKTPQVLEEIARLEAAAKKKRKELR